MAPDQIRNIRHRLGLNQYEFGQLLDVGRNTIVNWETGRTTPPELKQDIIRQLGEEAEQHQQNDEWVRKLLALAAGGMFGILLGKLFSKPDADE